MIAPAPTLTTLDVFLARLAASIAARAAAAPPSIASTEDRLARRAPGLLVASSFVSAVTLAAVEPRRFNWAWYARYLCRPSFAASSFSASSLSVSLILPPSKRC